MRKATVASKEVLATHGASSIEIGSSTQLHIRNWVFKSSHNSICSSKQLAELARRIESIVTPEQQLRSSDDDNIHINSFSMRLPPMLFLDDTISASYIPAKVEIKVSASDALTTWASKHSASYMHQYPLSIIQVPYAKNWLERSLPNAVFPSSSSTTTPSGQVNANTDTPDIKTTVLPKWDWTFSSDYCFSVSTSSEATILSGRRLADHLYRTQGNALQYPALSSSSIACSDNGTDWEKMEWVCQPAAHSGLDMNLLRQSGPDSPILFYDEVLLYQVRLAL